MNWTTLASAPGIGRTVNLTDLNPGDPQAAAHYEGNAPSRDGEGAPSNITLGSFPKVISRIDVSCISMVGTRFVAARRNARHTAAEMPTHKMSKIAMR